MIERSEFCFKILLKATIRFSRLASDVSDLFTEICLVEFVNASCNICLIGYYIVTVRWMILLEI